WRLTVEPGERSEGDIAIAGGIRSAPRYYRDPKTEGGAPAPAASVADADRSKFPEVRPIGDLEFPAIERTTLSNGMQVRLARRTTVPRLRVAVTLDAGNAADPKEKLGTQALMLSLLDEGTKTRNSIQIAEEQERLGATIGS